MTAARLRLGVLAMLLLACGCGQEPAPCGSLEIRAWSADTGAFEPLADGDLVPIVLAADSLRVLVLSVRAQAASGIDPHEPQVDLVLQTGVDSDAGAVVGTTVHIHCPDMEPDGQGGYVSYLEVGLRVNLCCANCHPLVLAARLQDAQGKCFERRLIVVPAVAECPDASICCESESTARCPAPLSPTLCQ